MSITALPTPPSRDQESSVFVTNANAFLAALPTFGTEANALAAQVTSDKNAAATSASNAAASETAAKGAANYKGDYSASTTYAIGESVSYLGDIFIKKSAAAAGTTPVDGSDWLLANPLRESGGTATGTIQFDAGAREPALPMPADDISMANGGVQTRTLTANATFTESLADGDSVLLHLAGGDTYSVTWPTMTWVGGSAPTLTADDVLVIWQRDTTVYGNYLGSVV